MTEGHAGIKVLNCVGNHAAEAGDQVGEEANVSPVAPAVVSQVWQLEAPFFFEGAEHENSCVWLLYDLTCKDSSA